LIQDLGIIPKIKGEKMMSYNIEKKKKLNLALGRLADLYENPEVSEIMVDGPQKVTYEMNGKLHNDSSLINSQDEIQKIIEKVFQVFTVKTNEDETIYHMNLIDNDSLTIVFPTVVVGGSPILIIRKCPTKTLTWEDLIKFNSVSVDVVNILKKVMIENKSSILLAGGIASSLTTIYNLLMSSLPEKWRVISIERPYESIINHKWTVLLKANLNDEKTFVKLIKSVPLLRADFIGVYPMSGSAATVETINLMKSGYYVLAASQNVEGPMDAIKRIELNLLSGNLSMNIEDVREIISTSIKYICFHQRLPDGRRKIIEVLKMDGLENNRYCLVPLIKWQQESDSWELTTAGKKFLN
jgi:pilus assembly protein CpaF